MEADVNRLFYSQAFSKKDEDDQNIAPLINAIDASSRLNRQSAFVVDFASHTLIYKSERLLYIDEVTSSDRQRECINPYWALMSDDVLAGYISVVDNYLLVKKDLSSDEFSSHICVFEYPIVVRGHELYITQKFTPIVMQSNGDVKVGLFVIGDSNKTEMDCLIITPTKRRYRFDFNEKRFINIGLSVTLSIVEKAILHRAKMGLTNEEIARSLYLSVNTVKTHRTRIFKKLHVDTITEALMVAANHYLL